MSLSHLTLANALCFFLNMQLWHPCKLMFPWQGNCNGLGVDKQVDKTEEDISREAENTKVHTLYTLHNQTHIGQTVCSDSRFSQN